MQSPFIAHRSLAFWSLHALGWGAYGISHYLGALLYSKPASYVKVIYHKLNVSTRAEATLAAVRRGLV